MKLKSLLIAVAVLTALSFAVWFAQRPAPLPSTDVRLGQPLADPAAVASATKLRIADAGKTVSLAKNADGTWRVTSFYDLPADFQKLSRFVDDLSAAKLLRLVTTSPERIARLEFKDTQLALLDSADKELWSVTLGKNAETGGGRFVKFGPEQKAYLASFAGWLDTDSKNWANAELLNLKPEDIAKIEIPFADSGPVTVSRVKKDDAWAAAKTPAGQKLKVDKISSALPTLTNIRFIETSDLADPTVAAAKSHSRAFKLTTFDGKTITVAFARKPEEKKIKPPVPDAKSGPSTLGTTADLTKKDAPAATGDAKSDEKKPGAPEFETIPAGPLFVTVAHSDAAAPVNALMQKRAFQLPDYGFTTLPQKADELFEPAPLPPAPAKPVETKPDAPKNP